MISKKTHKEIEDKFPRADWITQQSSDGLIEGASSSIETNINNNSVSKQQCLTEFEVKCSFLFPVGRKFANYRQLDVYVTHFLRS